jgi:hypothetical protein
MMSSDAHEDLIVSFIRTIKLDLKVNPCGVRCM